MDHEQELDLNARLADLRVGLAVLWLACAGLAACGGRSSQNPDGELAVPAAGGTSNARGGASSAGQVGSFAGAALGEGGADFAGVEQPATCHALPPSAPGSLEIDAPWQTVDGVGQGGLLAIAADDSGVYWFDASLTLHALRAGEPENVLRDATAKASITGLIATPDRLVWSEVAQDSGLSQLRSIPKVGGKVQALTDDVRTVIKPFGFDAGSVYAVMAEGDAFDLLQLNERTTSQISLPLPNLPFGLRSGGAFLWDQGGVVARLDLATYELSRVGTMGGVPQTISDRFAISLVHEPNHNSPIDHFQLLELATGCLIQLPETGTAIAQPIVADDAYVYWISRPAAAPGAPSPELRRISVESGALEHLLLEGSAALPGALVGADSKALYVRAGTELLRVEKP